MRCKYCGGRILKLNDRDFTCLKCGRRLKKNDLVEKKQINKWKILKWTDNKSYKLNELNKKNECS